jgi:energy-coupling factor transporter ATP-binding protein EcfA2
MTLFQHLNRDQGITVVVVTHDTGVAAWSKRVVTFKDGLVVGDRPVDEELPEAARTVASGGPTVQGVRTRTTRSCCASPGRPCGATPPARS